ncbi:hypothetical protein F4225_01265 [Candidatus Poribacteria bacterium]|nr:hypothetical protein [Candidatus Poribacteria bacterium]
MNIFSSKTKRSMKMRKALFLCFNVLIILFIGCIPFLQKHPKEIKGQKITTSPVIDGKLDDQVWQKARRHTGFVDRNMNNEPAEDQTAIQLVYSDKAIYLAWYCYDAQPDQIVTNVIDHQMRPFAEDWISFTIDPSHTHQFTDRVFFMSNPNGIKFISHPPLHIPLNELPNRWNVGATIVDDGWIVEMEIPWELLNYPQTDEPIDIGINFDRGHFRTGANTWWSKVRFIEDDRNDGHWVNVLPPPK